jgi:hypothetical protein
MGVVEKHIEAHGNRGRLDKQELVSSNLPAEAKDQLYAQSSQVGSSSPLPLALHDSSKKSMTLIN